MEAVGSLETPSSVQALQKRTIYAEARRKCLEFRLFNMTIGTNYSIYWQKFGYEYKAFELISSGYYDVTTYK